MALEDREGVVSCSDSCDSIGNGIDYCSRICVCVLVRASLIDETNRWPWNMGTRWMLYGSVEYFEWFMVMTNTHSTSRRKIQSIQSLWSLHPLSSISHPSLVEDKGAFRALMRSHGVMTSLHLISITAVIKAKEDGAQSDTYSTLNLWEWRCFTGWNVY